jgi:Na+-transporting NADH:ubiquinone oxidoreductase subunit D
MRLPSESKQQLFIKNLFSENGLLFSGTGIFLAVAGTRTTEQAFFLGSICLALILVNSIASSIAGDIFRYRIPLWAMALASAVMLAVIGSSFAARLSHLPEHTVTIMYLLAAGPVVFSRAQAFSHTTSLGRAMFDAAGQGVGILLVMMAVAFVRELIGKGYLSGGLLFSRPPWPMLGLAFGGMLLTALAMVIYRISVPGGRK